jgi:hypothetical protein
MLQFELPILHDQASIGDAIEEMIEAGTSGLLVRGTARRNLRVVHFDRAVAALNGGMSTLEQMEFRPVVDLEAIAESDDASVANALTAEGKEIAFIGLKAGKAQLFSVSEIIGGPFAAVSAGVRCQRPNRPPPTPPRHWYHYYPPTNRNAGNPNKCRVCGAYVP